MKPVQFRARYRFRTLHPDHVATIEDMARAKKFYAVWQSYDSKEAFTVLRLMFQKHEDAARYATRFQDRYRRLIVAKIQAEFRAKYPPKRLKWWQVLAARLVALFADRRRRG